MKGVAFLGCIVCLPVLLAATCKPNPPSPVDVPIPPAPVVDASPMPPMEAGSDPCARACARYRKLGCIEGQPTPKGEQCEHVCQVVESSGVLSLNPACVAQAATCADARKCQR